MRRTSYVDDLGERLLDFDNRTHKLFRPFDGAWPIKALGAICKLGDQPELRTIAAALLASGTFASNDRLVRAGARMLIAHEAATLVKDSIKTNVDRTRPRSAKGRDDKKPRKGKHTGKEMTSFPSGHSAGAVAAARALSREFPEYGAVLVGGAAFIALAQIPRCAHYPTDVAAGVAIGLVVEMAVAAVWDAASMDERSAVRPAA